MNCADTRRHLHPWLDDELDLDANLRVLAHLNACSACQALFEGEERMGERYRQALGGVRMPDALRAKIAAELALESRPWARLWHHHGPAIARGLGLGAAAAAVFFGTLLYESADPSAATPRSGIFAEGPSAPLVAPPYREAATRIAPLSPREQLLRLLAEAHERDPRVPNPLSMDGPVALPILAARYDAHPAISSRLAALADPDTLVVRLPERAIAHLRIAVVHELILPSGVRVAEAAATNEHLLLVTRGNEVFLVLDREGSELAPIFERSLTR